MIPNELEARVATGAAKAFGGGLTKVFVAEVEGQDIYVIVEFPEKLLPRFVERALLMATAVRAIVPKHYHVTVKRYRKGEVL